MARTNEGPAAPALNRRSGLLEVLDQSLNPMLVKDLRCWLRSRRFVFVFFLALGVSQLATLFTIAVHARDPDSARTLFIGIMASLGFVTTGVVPMMLLGSFADELRNRSSELAMISRLSPRQLVRGKTLGSLAADSLFLAAFTPCLTVAYLLGGVDPITALFALWIALASALGSTTVSILVVSIAGKRLTRILSLLPLGFGTAVGATLLSLLEAGEIPMQLRRAGFLALNGILLFNGVLLLLFLSSVATGRLSFPADNRDTRPRVMLTLLTSAVMLSLAVMPGFVHTAGTLASLRDAIHVGLLSASIVLVAGSLLIMETPDSLSPRIRSTWPRSRIIRIFYLPGRGRLYFYILAHLAALSTVAIVLASIPPWAAAVSMPNVIFLAISSMIVAISFLGSTTLLQHLLRRFKLIRWGEHPRAMGVVEVAIAWSALGIATAVLGEAMELPEPLRMLSPATAVQYLADRKEILLHNHLISMEDIPGSLSTGVGMLAIFWAPGLWFWLRCGAQALRENRQVTAQRHAPHAPRLREGNRDAAT